MNKIRSTIGGLALMATATFGATNDGSRISKIESTTSFGKPAMKITVDALVPGRIYNIQYSTNNLTNAVWTKDSYNLYDDKKVRTLIKPDGPSCFYRLLRQE